MINELPYWIALSHLPSWRRLAINKLITTFFHENGISVEDFFNLDESVWVNDYSLDEKQIADLKTG